MPKLIIGAVVGVFVLGLQASSALAYHCPRLVEECNALVTKLEKNPQADTAQVAEAKQGCEDALQLHSDGQHADAVIKAGDAISMAGKAVK